VERRAHDAAVLGKQVRVGIAALVDQLGRSFDVGEQEGDRPGRERGLPVGYSR